MHDICADTVQSWVPPISDLTPTGKHSFEDHYFYCIHSFLQKKRTGFCTAVSHYEEPGGTVILYGTTPRPLSCAPILLPGSAEVLLLKTFYHEAVASINCFHEPYNARWYILQCWARRAITQWRFAASHFNNCCSSFQEKFTGEQGRPQGKELNQNQPGTITKSLINQNRAACKCYSLKLCICLTLSEQALEITGLENGGLCDVRASDCTRIRVFGLGFKESPNLRCEVTRLIVSKFP